MTIAIEAQRIFRPNKHGMDFVALETIRELQKRNDDNKYFVIVAPGEDRCLIESANLSIIELKCPTYLFWEQVALPRIKGRLITLHFEYSSHTMFGSPYIDTSRHYISGTQTTS